MSIESQNNFSELFLKEVGWLPDDDEIHESKPVLDWLHDLEAQTGESVTDFAVVAKKIESLLADGLVEVNEVNLRLQTELRITQAGLNYLNDLDASLLPRSSPDEIQILQAAIDSTNWTGLGKRISQRHQIEIREKSKSLLKAIIQSDADIQTRTDACKRVEATILLLEAPNVPWREVVSLLNHPAVTALFAGLSLIQFIIGLAN